VLFADVRGYTSMAEARCPGDVARLMNRFYSVATSVLAAHQAVIDKLIGDQVMALFIRGFAGDQFVGKMTAAAEELLHGVGYGGAAEPWLRLGVGLDYGRAFVGNVGTGEVKDFTALGDVVNTAARLQAEAKQGQIIMSERVFQAAGAPYADAPVTMLTLKGKSEPVQARILDRSLQTVAG